LYRSLQEERHVFWPGLTVTEGLERKLSDPPTGPQDPECEFAATELTLPTGTRYVDTPPLAVVLVPQRILTPANTSTREASQAGGIAARTYPEKPRESSPRWK
jgi:hypothetical protein